MVSRSKLALMLSAACITASSLNMSAASAQDAKSWTGFYVGASAGYQTGSLSGDDESLDLDGFAGGAYAGYLFSSGPAVFGLEASYIRQDTSFSETTNDGFTTDTLTLAAENLILLKARAGVLVGPALVYATGGIGWTDPSVTFDIVDNFGAGSATISETIWTTGYVVGGGVELPISKSLKLRGEALYQDFNVEFTGAEEGSYGTTLIQGGLTYTFN